MLGPAGGVRFHFPSSNWARTSYAVFPSPARYAPGWNPGRQLFGVDEARARAFHRSRRPRPGSPARTGTLPENSASPSRNFAGCVHSSWRPSSRRTSAHYARGRHTFEWRVWQLRRTLFPAPRPDSRRRVRTQKLSAMRRCWQAHTSLLVNTPVRSGEMSASRSSDSTRMEVSSLCTASACAACRFSSSRAGWSGTRFPPVFVAAGSGIPRLSSSFSRRFQGNPLP